MKTKFMLLTVMVTTALVWGRDPIPMDLTPMPIGSLPSHETRPGVRPPAGFPVDPKPGIEPGPTKTHKLFCEAPHNKHGVMNGMRYSMTCDTRELSPEKSQIGCRLFKMPVRPNAKSTEIILKVDKSKKETKSKAYFVTADPDDSEMTVVASKNPVSVSVKFVATGTYFTCGAKPRQ